MLQQGGYKVNGWLAVKEGAFAIAWKCRNVSRRRLFLLAHSLYYVVLVNFVQLCPLYVIFRRLPSGTKAALCHIHLPYQWMLSGRVAAPMNCNNKLANSVHMLLCSSASEEWKRLTAVKSQNLIWQNITQECNWIPAFIECHPSCWTCIPPHPLSIWCCGSGRTTTTTGQKNDCV